MLVSSLLSFSVLSNDGKSVNLPNPPKSLLLDVLSFELGGSSNDGKLPKPLSLFEFVFSLLLLSNDGKLPKSFVSFDSIFWDCEF